jgi:hypothetical protein
VTCIGAVDGEGDAVEIGCGSRAEQFGFGGDLETRAS